MSKRNSTGPGCIRHSISPVTGHNLTQKKAFTEGEIGILSIDKLEASLLFFSSGFKPAALWIAINRNGICKTVGMFFKEAAEHLQKINTGLIKA